MIKWITKTFTIGELGKLFTRKIMDKIRRRNNNPETRHWGARKIIYPKIMDNIRRRNNNPETRRLMEQRNALSRPGTLRCRYDHQTQRTVFAPPRPNKRSREEIAEIDAELIRRANRLGEVLDRQSKNKNINRTKDGKKEN